MISKLKEFSKDTAIYGISTIAGKFINIILIPFYTNVFSPDIVGIYANIYAYMAFLNLLFIYGMDAAFMKLSLGSGTLNKKRFFSTSFIFILFTSIMFSLLFYLLSGQMIHLMEIPHKYSGLYIYLILILFFDALALVPFANLRINMNSIKFSVIRILAIIINISLNFILVLVYDFGIEAILISNLAASVITFIILIPEIARNWIPVVDKAFLKRIVIFTIPYLPASLAAQVIQVADRPILQSLTDSATVGIYQANYKLGVFMMLIVSIFQFSWFPFFLNTASEKNAKEIFSKIMTVFILFMSVIWVILTLFLDDLARIEIFSGKSIIGKDFLGGLFIVPVILLSYIFNGIYVNLNAGIYIEGKTKYLPVITGSGALVNIILNFVLIPEYGIMGAALATLFSYITMSVVNYFIVQKFYRIEYEFGKLFKMLSLILVSIIIYYILYFSGNLIFINKILFLLSFISLLFLLKIMKKGEIASMIRRLVKT